MRSAVSAARWTFLTRDCAKPFEVNIRKVSRVAKIALSVATIGVNLAVAQSKPTQTPLSLAQLQEKETGIAIGIFDPSGAVISKAEVMLTNSAGETLAAASTDKIGQWQMTGLRPGSYVVSVNSFGFQTQHENVIVTPGDTTMISFTLPIGTSGGIAVLSETGDSLESVPMYVDSLNIDVPATKIEPRIKLQPVTPATIVPRKLATKFFSRLARKLGF